MRVDVPGELTACSRRVDGTAHCTCPVVLAAASLVEGQSTEVFKKNGKLEFADLSFSLIYPAKGGSRTLDIVCKEKREVPQPPLREQRCSVPIRSPRNYMIVSTYTHCFSRVVISPLVSLQYNQWVTSLMHLIRGPPPPHMLEERLRQLQEAEGVREADAVAVLAQQHAKISKDFKKKLNGWARAGGGRE